jgi:hypothetical protein
VRSEYLHDTGVLGQVVVRGEAGAGFQQRSDATLVVAAGPGDHVGAEAGPADRRRVMLGVADPEVGAVAEQLPDE